MPPPATSTPRPTTTTQQPRALVGRSRDDPLFDLERLRKRRKGVLPTDRAPADFGGGWGRRNPDAMRRAHAVLECLKSPSTPGCVDATPYEVVRWASRNLEGAGGYEAADVLLTMLCERAPDGRFAFHGLPHRAQSNALLMLKLCEDRFFRSTLLAFFRALLAGLDAGSAWMEPFGALVLGEPEGDVTFGEPPSRLLPVPAAPESSPAAEVPADVPTPPPVPEPACGPADLNVALLAIQSEGANQECTARVMEAVRGLDGGVAGGAHAAIDGAVREDTLRCVLRALVTSDTSVVDAAACFRVLLRGHAVSSDNHPSEARVQLLAEAMQVHPKALTAEVIRPMLASPTLNRNHFELIGKTARACANDAACARLLECLVEAERVGEMHIVCMQQVVRSAEALDSVAALHLARGLGRAAARLPYCVPLVKLIQMVLKRFPGQALEHREALMDALGKTNTFMTKAVTRAVERLRG